MSIHTKGQVSRKRIKRQPKAKAAQPAKTAAAKAAKK